MLLIADSGSTKTDWGLIDTEGNCILRLSGLGMNPNITGSAQLIQRIESLTELRPLMAQINRVEFFGAGCSDPENVKKILSVLAHFFPQAAINIQSDMAGAVAALPEHLPCMVAILGTGANSCYFDGSIIHGLDYSLGYILGDAGSGAWLGKQLLSAWWHGELSPEMRHAFEDTFPVSRALILQQVYQGDAPAAFLASFAPFIFNHRDNVLMHTLLQEGFDLYIRHYLLRFKTETGRVHFFGSISVAGMDMLSAALPNYGLSASGFHRSPMDGLIKKYANKI